MSKFYSEGFAALFFAQDERLRKNQPVYTYEDWRYYAQDDMETKAWKAGFLHSYRGLANGWIDEDTMYMYELGKADGLQERERTLARGEEDPHNW